MIAHLRHHPISLLTSFDKSLQISTSPTFSAAVAGAGFSSLSSGSLGVLRACEDVSDIPDKALMFLSKVPSGICYVCSGASEFRRCSRAWNSVDLRIGIFIIHPFDINILRRISYDAQHVNFLVTRNRPILSSNCKSKNC
jgi:hypothetical protein